VIAWRSSIIHNVSSPGYLRVIETGRAIRGAFVDERTRSRLLRDRRSSRRLRAGTECGMIVLPDSCSPAIAGATVILASAARNSFLRSTRFQSSLPVAPHVLRG